MITKHHSHYLPFLSQEHKILLLSDREWKCYENIKTIFSKMCQRNLQEAEFDNLSATIINNHIDIIILDATQDSKKAKEFYNVIERLNQEIVIMTIINKTPDSNAINLIELSDNVIVDSFTKGILEEKLFELLSIFYTTLSIKKEDLILKNNSLDINQLIEFLDVYKGSALFIVDELMELNINLKNGELSKELLTKIGKNVMNFQIFFLKMN